MTHQDIQLSAPPPGAAADTEDPPPTATPADVAAWAVDAGWGTPFVTITQDRGGERDCIRVVAAEVTATALIVALDNGQVFQLEAVELTRPASQPGRLFTLNPPGQRSTHAILGSAALCSLSAASEQASPDWEQVTCLDCRAAAPARPLGDLDHLDLAMAERQVRDALIAASPQPLPVYEVMRRIDPGYRAAAQTALGKLARQGTVFQTPAPDGAQAYWSWAAREQWSSR